jgi:hypothetical protein
LKLLCWCGLQVQVLAWVQGQVLMRRVQVERHCPPCLLAARQQVARERLKQIRMGTKQALLLP